MSALAHAREKHSQGGARIEEAFKEAAGARAARKVAKSESLKCLKDLIKRLQAALRIAPGSVNDKMNEAYRAAHFNLVQSDIEAAAEAQIQSEKEKTQFKEVLRRVASETYPNSYAHDADEALELGRPGAFQQP